MVRGDKMSNKTPKPFTEGKINKGGQNKKQTMQRPTPPLPICKQNSYHDEYCEIDLGTPGCNCDLRLQYPEEQPTVEKLAREIKRLRYRVYVLEKKVD